MLRISKLADYGTVIMDCLARSPDALISASDIAQRVHLTLPTASKILKILVAANLVISARGAGGGYRLARSPEQITVASVITALDGHPALTACSNLTKTCPQEAVCTMRNNWRIINQIIMGVLESLTLVDMAQPLDCHPIATEVFSSFKKV